jgi:hypothetical protein
MEVKIDFKGVSGQREDKFAEVQSVKGLGARLEM